MLTLQIPSCGVLCSDSVWDESGPGGVIRRWGVPSEAFIIFTDNTRSSDPSGLSSGRRLANYIRENDLGHVTITRPRRNHNSERDIQVFVYHVDQNALRAWRETH